MSAGRLWAIVGVLIATPATAAHCPQGKIWRIRLGQCVDANSALARAYVHPLRRQARLSISRQSPLSAPASIMATDEDPERAQAVEALKAALQAQDALKLQLKEEKHGD
jgi:hypothetical protein